MVELICDEKSSAKIVELCYKILLLAGLARANPEDFLVAASLLEENPRHIDLKEELTHINKAFEKASFQSSSDDSTDDKSKAKDTEEMFELKRIGQKARVYALSESMGEDDSLVSDGKYLYYYKNG